VTQEALKLALEALEGFYEYGYDRQECFEHITAIKEALAKEKALQALHNENERLGLYKDAYAQPEQEPVGKLQEPAAERAWFTIAELNAWADKKLSENPHWVMPKDEPERKEALAQTQEPVAYLCENAVGHKYFRWKKPSSTYKPIPLYTTPPQRTWVGLGWLPEHKCGLHLSHNEHRDVYETIEEFYDAEDFISPEEWREAVAKDSVWVLHWYPETPIGFIRIAASTLEAIEAKVKETK
jgi:hypothetical protein